MSHIFPVILSGGSGTRLWPLSRSMYPKQFIRFFDNQNTSFLGAALARLPQSAGFERPILLCNNDHRFLVREEVERAGIMPRAIVLEPIARNTAPAIAVAALIALRDNANAILAVMPSDHVIADEARFAKAMKRAADVAATGKLVLFGVTPTEAHTGYGYIKRGAALPGFDGDAFSVDGFAEKPDHATAERYLAEGSYLWNSGIFVLNAKRYLSEIERYEPKILEAARAALAGASEDLGFLRLEKAGFAESPNISIDYAVMEKTHEAAILPIDVGWNDVGSWSALWSVVEQDGGGNAHRGDVIALDCQDTLAIGDKRLIALIGLQDTVVIDTDDAVLVAHKDRVQEVKEIVAELKRAQRPQATWHRKVYRPWGTYDGIDSGERFQVKRIIVKPGAALSLQKHHHRAEHWIVVKGTAQVTCDDKVFLLSENESTYIPLGSKHRLENPGKQPLELIEVQSGSYLGEDDIVRFEDVYGRSAS